MRSAAQIKAELIRLRWTNKLPISEIAKRSGCTPGQIMSAMQLDASETIQRRIDAYLDAKALHKVDKQTRLLYRIERMTRELLMFYGERSLPMRDVQLLSTDRQKRLENAMQWRLKNCLRKLIAQHIGHEPLIADGLSYWQAKKKMIARYGEIQAPAQNRPGPAGRQA